MTKIVSPSIAINKLVTYSKLRLLNFKNYFSPLEFIYYFNITNSTPFLDIQRRMSAANPCFNSNNKQGNSNNCSRNLRTTKLTILFFFFLIVQMSKNLRDKTYGCACVHICSGLVLQDRPYGMRSLLDWPVVLCIFIAKNSAGYLWRLGLRANVPSMQDQQS